VFSLAKWIFQTAEQISIKFDSRMATLTAEHRIKCSFGSVLFKSNFTYLLTYLLYLLTYLFYLLTYLLTSLT